MSTFIFKKILVYKKKKNIISLFIRIITNIYTFFDRIYYLTLFVRFLFIFKIYRTCFITVFFFWVK